MGKLGGLDWELMVKDMIQMPKIKFKISTVTLFFICQVMIKIPSAYWFDFPPPASAKHVVTLSNVFMPS